MWLWTGYLEHEQDRTVFIDIDLHHGEHASCVPNTTL
jgi:hypothetical protein